jgi:hypothetical protein
VYVCFLVLVGMQIEVVNGSHIVWSKDQMVTHVGGDLMKFMFKMLALLIIL